MFVVVAHVAERDHRVLLRVGLHDREGHRADRGLGARRGIRGGRRQAQVLFVRLLVHPAGTLCTQGTYTMPPAGTGFDPCAQASAVETMVVRQFTPSVESVSMIGLGTTVEKNG
jgi:hypothetical protein